MNYDGRNPTIISWILAFLIGVILFWSIGKDWLDLESAAVFLAGLLGVALVVLLFGLWTSTRTSHSK